MKQKEQKLMKYLVEKIGSRLGEAVARLGGDKAKQNLEDSFNASIQESRFESSGSGFKVALSEADWSDGEAVFKQLFDKASSVVGNKTVKKEVAEVLADTESKVGSSLYEVYFRLGLHKYQ